MIICLYVWARNSHLLSLIWSNYFHFILPASDVGWIKFQSINKAIDADFATEPGLSQSIGNLVDFRHVLTPISVFPDLLSPCFPLPLAYSFCVLSLRLCMRLNKIVFVWKLSTKTVKYWINVLPVIK